MTNKQIDLTLEQVETIKDMCVKLNVVSVYDLDVYTSMELYYKLANKVNEIINELWRFETTLSKELIEQNKELEFLLNEGLVIEVSKKVISLIDDGTISNLINNKIFKGLEEKISVLNSIKEILKDIDLTGEQDCSEKINEAIAIVERINETDPYSREKGLGAYEIQLPPGKLRIEKPLEIGAHGIIITGCGRHGTILLNRISNTSIANDTDCWNSATIRNKNMYSYKQRILVKDLSIDLGNSERVGIDLTSIGQSNIERVSIFGYDKKGIGFKITSLKKNTNDEQVAGHLNTLLNCTAQDVNIGVYINGGSNMNRVVFGEFYNNEIGVKIDNRSISSLTGGANIIECVRLENNNICIDDNSQYTRVLNNYFDGTVSIAINLAEASYFPYLQNNHYSPTVTTKIQKKGTTRSNTITDNYLGQYKGESFEFAGGGKFYGGVGSANVELRDKALKVVNQVTSDAYFSTPGYYRLSTGLNSNPTHRMSLFLDSDLQLCFVDKNGTKRIIAFQ